jgi:hypothetical protein
MDNLSVVITQYAPYFILFPHMKKDHEIFEMWCRRKVEKISWTDRVKNEQVLHRVK